MEDLPYRVEYAKSGRAGCRGCHDTIAKDLMRIARMVQSRYHDGKQAHWYHTACFFKRQRPKTEGDFAGFENLRYEDQELINNKIDEYVPKRAKKRAADDVAQNTKTASSALKAVNNEMLTETKKTKLAIKSEVKDEVDAAGSTQLDTTLMSQNKEYFMFRDNLSSNLKKKQMISILEENNQDIPRGMNAILDRLSDILTFGALERCPACKGQYVFKQSIYICNGNIDEWVKCESMLKEPPRKPACMPQNLNLDKFTFLNRKYKVMARALKYVPPSVSTLTIKREELLAPTIGREKPPLHNMEFFIMGRLGKSWREEIAESVQKLGGKVVSKLHYTLAAVISNEKEVEKMSEKMVEVKKMGIQVVKDTFVDELDSSGAIAYIRTRAICDWGNDPAVRIPQQETMSRSKSNFTKSVPKSVTLKLKNGTAVDPDSGLDDEAHVLIQGKTKYFAILSKTDIQRDQNSYYKLQILESDFSKKYWVFRSWGRIGTTIGGNKLESFHSDVSEAIENFKEVYLNQTGCVFGSANQQKIPGRYYAVETDFGGDTVETNWECSKVKSELEAPVQDLVKLLFDVNAMKKAMLEFDLDMEKMPLGKLSQKQLLEALQVLKQISEYVRDGATNAQFIGSSNKFFTLIPHDYGVDRPPVINTVEMVNTKTEMIESLMEMQFAYGMLKNELSDVNVNPIDVHYKHLNTELKTLAHDSEEFALLKKYVENTHADTHGNYELEIQDIFAVDRQGEKQRYKPFQQLHNRQLLWHGTRLTNYVGILSHGLKIAPPEAPVTGYMFGKGIYFADMVSKSANYCFTSRQNSTGLMMLCEVALGDMLECNQAKYVTKLPDDKHSTKGVGRTYPNAQEAHKRADGVEIPLGKPVTDNQLATGLLYNEYIVYDVAQVNVQYLFRMNFKHKF